VFYVPPKVISVGDSMLLAIKEGELKPILKEFPLE